MIHGVELNEWNTDDADYITPDGCKPYWFMLATNRWHNITFPKAD